jgi:predicted nuclease of restriction endonuclease-like (RecB) superfamily
LYWDLGQLIVVQQEKLGWGKSVVERLSKDLQATFPGVNGFSAQNLWNMRLVYLELRDNPNLQSLTGEIAWTHSVSILTKCKNDLEREFYILHSCDFHRKT